MQSDSFESNIAWRLYLLSHSKYWYRIGTPIWRLKLLHNADTASIPNSIVRASWLLLFSSMHVQREIYKRGSFDHRTSCGFPASDDDFPVTQILELQIFSKTIRAFFRTKSALDWSTIAVLLFLKVFNKHHVGAYRQRCIGKHFKTLSKNCCLFLVKTPQ